MPRTLIGNFKGPKGNTGEQGIQGPPGPQGPAGEKGDPGMVDENTPIIFEVPKEYEAPEPGDAIKALFGKIAKGLSDLFAAIGVLASLKTVDKSTLVAAVNELAEGKFDVAKLVASTTITEPGFAMDGKTASEVFAELYSKFASISDGSKPNNPKQVIKDKWDTLPTGAFLLTINCGTVYAGVVQKVNNSYGAVIIFGYSGGATPILIRKSGTDWYES